MLKDWKKIGKLSWKKRNNRIDIYEDLKNVYVYQVYTTLDRRKFFKSKSQALRFAKQYMRKH